MAVTFPSTSKNATTVNGDTGPLSVPGPAGVQSGDVLLALVVATFNTGTDSTFTVPTGYTLVPGAVKVDDGSSTKVKAAYYQKAASGAESATSWSASNLAGGKLAVGIVTCRGVASVGDGVAVAQPNTSATRTISGTLSAGARIVSAFTDPYGSTWVGPDTELLEHTSASNTSFVICAGSTDDGAGAFSRSATASVATATGVQLAVGLRPAGGSSAPGLTVSLPVPNVVKAVGSAAAGGELAYSITQVSGPSQAATVLAAGVWGYSPASGDRVFDVTVVEAGGQSTVKRVTIPATATGGGVAGAYMWTGTDLVRVI